ncbi:MAG: EamA family transporter [Nanoarchaeota archaeon]|nr:EamA family transporter [Nanoarchaeota archaeon]MBU1631654.1 EamA family transporter [Nanoarchaeota archaeon]MBU1875752.1 EamA family transporter [Nanoarchaeota archaeon]
MKTQLWAIGLIIIAGLIGSFGPIYLKRGSELIKPNNKSTIYKNWFLIIGIIIYGLATLISLPALKYGELSVLYPFIGLSYVWVCLFSSFMLKEKMTFLKWIGIFTIIVGISFIGMSA